MRSNSVFEKLRHLLESESLDEIADVLAETIPRLLASKNYPHYFSTWEKNGFHVTPNHFYQPIPDTASLSDELWNKVSKLEGVEMNEEVQAGFLLNVFPKFRDEYSQFAKKPTGIPYQFYLNNGCFDGLDALVLHCMVRHFKPSLIIEIGSGFSTRISAKAALLNGNTEVIAIEPYPADILSKGFPGLTTLYKEKIENIDVTLFDRLEKDDILFIDTSHVVKIGGDVNRIFLEIIPRLKKGVVVHIHDIFFPEEYPKDWILKEQRFWTEQYLLQAFLQFNREFEVLFSNSYLPYFYGKEFQKTFPDSPCGGSSFWMKRID